MDTLALDYPGAALSGGDEDDLVITEDDGGGVPHRTDDVSRADTARAYPIGAVLGSYRLLQQIGAGGMGRVFVAEHVRLGRRVALKVLRSEFSGNLEAVKRFFAEARSVNCISHENIIEVSDFVESRNGPSFYIMELLQGHDLRGVQEREGILSTERVLRIAMQVCSGLGAAHAAGIVHRDLKPDNIFLIERGGQPDFVKLLDFGVAKLNATFEEAATFRSTVGMVVGTPDYMAPEQALGQVVNHLADVYATGVILYEMLAGRRPFIARSAREVMVQHLTVTPTPPSMLNPAGKIPPALEELILACLAKEPRDRPQSIQEVEDRLRAILDGLPAHRRATAERRRVRRGRPIELAGAAALVAVIAAWIWMGSGSLLASTPRIAAAEARLRARFTPHPLRKAIVGSRSAFTIEPAGAPPPSVTPMPTLVSTLKARPAELPAPPPPTPARSLTAPADKIVRRSAAATEPPPFNERRHAKLDRDGVLDPFE